MGRAPVDSIALGDRRSFWGLLLICLLALGPIVGLVSAATWNKIHGARMLRFQPHSRSITSRRWKTLYFSPEDWVPTDYADPSNPALWQSKTNRAQAAHARRIEAAGNGVLWLGTVFSEQELARAFFTSSNVLYLGRIHGRYRVYVDGEPIVSSDVRLQNRPIAVPLSLKRLKSGGPMYVGIEIINDSGAARPDELGGEFGEGFVSGAAVGHLDGISLWRNHSQPILLTALFLVIGGFFFLGWLNDGKKQEYAFFAAYAFHQSLLSLLSVDWIHTLGSAHFWDRTSVSLLVWEGSLGLLLGLSFARARRSWIWPVTLATVVLSFLPFLIPSKSATLVSWQNELFLWYVPLAYLRGSAACLVQWHLIKRRKNLVERESSLLRIGMGLGLVAALYFAEALNFSSADPAMAYFRWIHFMILVTLCGMSIAERPALKPIPGSLAGSIDSDRLKQAG